MMRKAKVPDLVWDQLVSGADAVQWAIKAGVVDAPLVSVEEPMAGVSGMDAASPPPAGAPADLRQLLAGIFGDVSPEELERARHSTRYQVLPFSAAIMALVGAIYGGYTADPGFVGALQKAAADAGVSLEEWLMGKRAQPDQGRAEIVGIFQENSMLAKRFVGVAVAKDSVLFEDQKGNCYIESGSGVTVILALKQRFGPQQARDTMGGFLALRCGNPTGQVGCVISTTGFGRKDEIETMMILAALEEAKLAGVVPNLHRKVGFRGRVEAIETLDINTLDPKGLVAMGLNSNTATELVEAYNNRKKPAAGVVEDLDAAKVFGAHDPIEVSGVPKASSDQNPAGAGADDILKSAAEAAAMEKFLGGVPHTISPAAYKREQARVSGNGAPSPGRS